MEGHCKICKVLKSRFLYLYVQKRKRMVTELTNQSRLKCGYNYPIGYLGEFVIPFLGKQVQAMGPLGSCNCVGLIQKLHISVQITTVLKWYLVYLCWLLLDIYLS